MLELIRRNWWTVSLRGLLFAVFGLLVIRDSQTMVSYSEGVYQAFGLFFKLGLMFAVSGIIIVLAALWSRRKEVKSWWVLLLSALPDFILSGYVLFNGQKATVYYIKIMGIWIVLLGIAFLLISFKAKGLRILLYILAAICAGFGLIVFFNPEFSLFSVHGTIAYFTVLLGLLIFSLGFPLRKLGLKSSENETGIKS